MKKAIVIIIFLLAVFRVIAAIEYIGADIDGKNQIKIERSKQEISSLQKTTSTEDIDTAIIISSDEYFEIVNDTIKNYAEPAGYSITRISTLRIPYYMFDCEATDIDTTHFTEDTLRIAENIYNTLLEHEYKQPCIFIQSHEIVSLTFFVIENGETTNRLCIQFDLTDIDRTKSFSENLKMPTHSIMQQK